MVQLLEPAIDQDVFDERPHDVPVGLGPVEVGRFGRSIDHGVTGRVGALALLDVVPVLDGQIVLEPEDFEADSAGGEVVLGVGEDVVSIRKGPHDVDAGRGLGQPFEQRRQTLAAFVSLGLC